MMETTPGGTRSVTARFDDGAKADRAIAWLLNIGVKQGQIRQIWDAAPDQASPAGAASQPQGKRRRGFMDSLVNFVLPDDTPATSAKGRKGSGPCTVAVTDIPAATYDTIVVILNDEGKIVLDPQEPDAVAAGVEVVPTDDIVVATDPGIAAGPVDAAQAGTIAGPASIDIAGASNIKGLIGACLVDSDSGMMLASEGGGPLDLNLVAALNSDSVRTGQHVIDQLGLNENIQEILINLNKQVHLIRPLDRNRSMFVYVALDKASSNLGMARLQLKNIEANMKI